MPAKPPKAFDVWFVTANTVYKAVPYNVVADWTQQGRLARTDMVRPAGSDEKWVQIAEHELLADYLPRPSAAKKAPAAAKERESRAGVTAEGKTTAPPRKTEQPDGKKAAAPAATPDEAPVELPEPEPGRRVSRFEEDDEVDMIPLIDISMVLLVFFIMIQAAGALAPVDVPEMKYAGQLTADPDAITITIEKLNTEDVYYSVRAGQANPQPGHDQLKTPEQAIAAMKDILKTVTRPPEVRIACRKDLPRERVYELRRDLEKERKEGKINNIVATVVEAPEQK
jgi:biopolymer transport protein ExbD